MKQGQTLAFSSVRTELLIPDAECRIWGLWELRAAPLAGHRGMEGLALEVEVDWGDRGNRGGGSPGFARNRQHHPHHLPPPPVPEHRARFFLALTP